MKHAVSTAMIILLLIQVVTITIDVQAETITPPYTINTRVLVIVYGVDENLANIVQEMIKKTYTANLDPTLGLELIVDVDLEWVDNKSTLYPVLKNIISDTIKEYSKYVSTKPEFIKGYIENKHPEWANWRIQLVKADGVEVELYRRLDEILDKIVGYEPNYILLLYYYPVKGVLRTYYVSKCYCELGLKRNFTGLIGFGGNTKLYFIDLSAIPGNHPNKTQPLYGRGRVFNYTNNPPLWDLPDNYSRAKQIAYYIKGYIGFLVIRALFSGRLPLKPNYIVNISIVDFSNGTGLNKLLKTFYKNRLVELLSRLVPYIKWNITLNIVNGNESIWARTLSRSLVANESRVILYDEVYNILSQHLTPTIKMLEDKVIIPVYVFTHSKPLFFTYGPWKLNFTGAALPGLGVIVSFPGYYNRVYEQGLSMVIAHEVGHLLGLSHPFEGLSLDTYNITMDWTFDFVASVMSYAPTLAGWREGIFYYDYKSLTRYHAVELLVKISKSTAMEPDILEALKLIERDECGKAIELLNQIALKLKYSSTTTITITKTTTTTLKETTTHTRTTTKTVIKTTTLTETLQKQVLVRETVTKTSTSTLTKTKTTTLTYKTTETITETSTITVYSTPVYIHVLILGLTASLVIAIALAIRSRRIGT